MADDVIAKSPRCMICACQVGSADHPMFQLPCLHPICAQCLPDIQQPSGAYKCPLDEQESPMLHTNEPLAAMIQQYWSNTHTEFEPQLKSQLLQQFMTQVNYQSMPCYTLGSPVSCSCPSCPYQHTFSPAFRRFPCPRRFNCNRKATFCLFSHPEFAVPQPIYDPQMSFRYAQVEPSQLHGGTVRQPTLPMTSQRVTHTEISRETAFFTTIERRVEANSGYIYLQSLSLFRFLTANNNAELDVLLGKYYAQAQMKTLKIIRKKAINWSYVSSEGSRRYFNIATSQLLEKAFKDGVEEVSIADNVVVNLRLMVKIHAAAVYTPVFRKESILSTSHAAVMELIAASEKYEIINKEVQLLEQSLLIPEDIPGEALEQILDEFGLAVNQEGWVKGAKSDLLLAGKRLKSIQAPEKISHIKLKPGTNAEVLKSVAKSFNLIALNNLLIGRESDLRRVREEDAAIELPQAPAETCHLICTKYRLQEVDGKWWGRLEALSDALTEVTECREQLPGDLSIREMRWILESFPVKVENQVIIGPKNAVKEAVEKLQKQRLVKPESAEPVLAERPMNGFETWYFTQKENCRLTYLDQRGPEYSTVLEKFEQELKHNVVSIRRIYNKKQYLAYKLKLNKLKDEEKDQVNEQELFYGSSRYDPEEMAQSEDGFKFKFTGGSWGTGFYFSEKAAKAMESGFAPKSRSSVLQILLCTVITGRASFQKASRAMRRPPPPEPGERPFHSVVGNGRGSTVWVVYEPDMARMKYLVTIRQPTNSI